MPVMYLQELWGYLSSEATKAVLWHEARNQRDKNAYGCQPCAERQVWFPGAEAQEQKENNVPNAGGNGENMLVQCFLSPQLRNNGTSRGEWILGMV
jgi:hypothetical protein